MLVCPEALQVIRLRFRYELGQREWHSQWSSFPMQTILRQGIWYGHREFSLRLLCRADVFISAKLDDERQSLNAPSDTRRRTSNGSVWCLSISLICSFIGRVLGRTLRSQAWDAVKQAFEVSTRERADSTKARLNRRGNRSELIVTQIGKDRWSYRIRLLKMKRY